MENVTHVLKTVLGDPFVTAPKRDGSRRWSVPLGAADSRGTSARRVPLHNCLYGPHPTPIVFSDMRCLDPNLHVSASRVVFRKT